MERNRLKNLVLIDNRTEGEQAILDLLIAQQNLDYALMEYGKDDEIKFKRINMAIEAITIAEKKIDLIKTKHEFNKILKPIPVLGEKEGTGWTQQLRKLLQRAWSA